MPWKIQKLTLEEEQKILDLYVKENLSIIQIYKKIFYMKNLLFI